MAEEGSYEGTHFLRWLSRIASEGYFVSYDSSVCIVLAQLHGPARLAAVGGRSVTNGMPPPEQASIRCIPVNGGQCDPVRLQHREPAQFGRFKVGRNIEVNLALRFSWFIRHRRLTRHGLIGCRRVEGDSKGVQAVLVPTEVGSSLPSKMKLIPGFNDLMSNREQKKEGWESKVICMRDEIDEEVRKLLEDMERNCDMSAVLNGAEDSVAQALRDVGELHERARQGVREAICALATHYDDLKDYPEYHKVATTLAGLDMILTPGFRLIIRAETERLGHSMAPREMLSLLMRILSNLSDDA